MAERLRLSDAALRGLFRKTSQAVASAPIRSALAIHDGDATDQSVDYRFIKMPPGLREWVDGRQLKGLEAATITIPLKKYDSAIDIKAEDLYFDRINQIQSTVGNWRNRVDEHWLELIFEKIVLGTSQTCYTGQYFFDSDHTDGDSGTFINLLTATQVTQLNVSLTAETADEMAKAIMGVIGYMLSYKDNHGKPANETASKFLVIVPWNLMGAAKQAVKSNLLNAAAGSYDNPLKNLDIQIEVISTARLTTTTVFYVVRTDPHGTAPFVTRERRMEEVYLGTGSDYYFENDAVAYGITSERGIGFGEPRDMVHCTLS